MLEAPERRRIERAANDARIRLGFGPGAVDALEALDRAGVAVLVYPFAKKAVDGIYRRTDTGAFAAVNSARPRSRQHFTAAHELGHHEFDLGPTQFVDEQLEAATDSPVEQRADEFAAAFLMDTGSLRGLLEQLGPIEPEAIVLTVAASYRVSVPVAAWRLVNLSLLDRADAQAVTKRRSTSLRDRLAALDLPVASAQTDKRRWVSDRYHQAVLALRESGVVPPSAFPGLLND